MKYGGLNTLKSLRLGKLGRLCRADHGRMKQLLGSNLSKQLGPRWQCPHELMLSSEGTQQILLRWFHLAGVHDQRCPTQRSAVSSRRDAQDFRLRMFSQQFVALRRESSGFIECDNDPIGPEPGDGFLDVAGIFELPHNYNVWLICNRRKDAFPQEARLIGQKYSGYLHEKKSSTRPRAARSA
jgi:hypothetical protein